MADIKSLDDLKSAVTESAPVAAVAAPRVSVRDALGRSYATGKRKNAVARVWIKPGSGKIDKLRAALTKELPEVLEALVAQAKAGDTGAIKLRERTRGPPASGYSFRRSGGHRALDDRRRGSRP